MTEATPSRTALGAARRRALHQLLDHPIVFEDPLAVRILVDIANLENRSNSYCLPALRAFVAARSRFAEDLLARAFAEGVRQYVILGAGLETFAYRNPFADCACLKSTIRPPGLEAISVEQSWNRRPRLCFVPASRFREQNAGGCASIDARVRSSPAGILRYARGLTVSFATGVTNNPQVCCLVAAYQWNCIRLYSRSYKLNNIERLNVELLAARVAKLGEPFRLFLHPDELVVTLRSLGFSWVEDLAAPAVNSRYFQNRSDELHVGEPGACCLRAFDTYLNCYRCARSVSRQSRLKP